MFVNNEFAYDKDEHYVGFSFSLIIQNDKQFDLKYILSILNSKFAQFWFYRNGKKRGAGVDIGVEKLRTFPIKRISNMLQKSFIDLVDEITDITKENDYLQNLSKQKAVQNLEHQIDQKVYELYGFS
jgi:hypothetical protein